MSGMKNGVLVAKNADYTQVDGPNPQSSESNGLILDNQVWLGSTSTNAGGTHINVTTLTAGTGVTLTRNTGVTPNTLTIAASASLANLYTADSGTATPSAGNLNVLTALGATNINNHPVSSTGSGSTLTLNWNNILPPTLAVSGTVNLTYLDYGVVCIEYLFCIFLRNTFFYSFFFFRLPTFDIPLFYPCSFIR